MQETHLIENLRFMYFKHPPEDLETSELKGNKLYRIQTVAHNFLSLIVWSLFYAIYTISNF